MDIALISSLKGGGRQEGTGMKDKREGLRTLQEAQNRR